MTALAQAYDARRRDGALIAYPVAAGAHIFKGGLVAVAASGAVPAVDAAGVTFVGVAYEEGDNRGGASGARKVRVLKTGVYTYPKAGASPTDMGKVVFVVDDGTVSTAATGSNVAAGVVVGVPDAGHVCVRIDGKVG